MIHTHYMPAEPPATPRKYFAYNLLGIRLPAPAKRMPQPPLPEWLCPRPIDHCPVTRLVTKANIMAPLLRFEDDEKILAFGSLS